MGNKRQRGQTAIQHIAGYDREQPLVKVEWTCVVCGKSHAALRLPGRAPRFCPRTGGEKSECQKKADYERLKRWRDSHRVEANRQQRAYRRSKKL